MPGLSAHSRARQKLGTKPVSGLSKTQGGRIVIAKKPAKTREKHQHHKGGRSPFWVRGTAQPRAPVEERALSVFQPDILVEHQYQSTARRRFHLDPERVLMLALLQDAVVCFQDNVSATCKRKQTMHLDAAAWIESTDRSYLFSFENVCDALGYDAEYMRQGLLRWKEMVIGSRSKKESRSSSVN
jgi:hypothetical protein